MFSSLNADGRCKCRNMMKFRVTQGFCFLYSSARLGPPPEFCPMAVGKWMISMEFHLIKFATEGAIMLNVLSLLIMRIDGKTSMMEQAAHGCRQRLTGHSLSGSSGGVNLRTSGLGGVRSATSWNFRWAEESVRKVCRWAQPQRSPGGWSGGSCVAAADAKGYWEAASYDENGK